MIGFHQGSTVASCKDLLALGLAPFRGARGSQISSKNKVQWGDGGRLRLEVRRSALEYRRRCCDPPQPAELNELLLFSSLNLGRTAWGHVMIVK